LNEYKRVLHHPRLSFAPRKIKTHINLILRKGIAIETETSTIEMIDESDRKFYDLHKAANAILITGNIKHFPKEDTIMKISCASLALCIYGGSDGKAVRFGCFRKLLAVENNGIQKLIVLHQKV
jgi:hypothetical protein